jgi:hypothetical protein
VAAGAALKARNQPDLDVVGNTDTIASAKKKGLAEAKPLNPVWWRRGGSNS